jgi:hypothetical protein
MRNGGTTMNAHLIEKLTSGAKTDLRESKVNSNSTDDVMTMIEVGITRSHAESRQGLWGIVVFLLISAGAILMRGTSILDVVPANLWGLLGDPLPPVFVHAILAVSTLSSFIIITGRIARGAAPGRITQLVMFRVFFFLLYFAANAMDQNLVLIFASGMLILGLDHFNRWSYCQREILSGKENLRKLALWPLAVSSGNNVKSNIR